MSEIRLYVDEDASEGAVIVALRARGIDVVTTAETGHLGVADADQLAWATEQERVLYTFNVRDFARLHGEYLSKGLRHCGIVVLPDQHCSTREKIPRVARFIRSKTAEDMSGHMEYL